MPLTNRQILYVLTQIMEMKGLSMFMEIAKNAIPVGMYSAAGGLFGGPLGLAIGGCVGSYITSNYGHGRYKSLTEVFREMPTEQRRELARSLSKIFRELRTSDVRRAIMIIMSDVSLQAQLLYIAKKFLQKRIGVRVI